ncbi:1687_t:CDS:2, partial [Funneliformis caledonium]
MAFSYLVLYSALLFALFISYNPILCKRYKYTPDELINGHLFYLEPAKTAFALDIKPISYPDKCELVQLHLNTRHGSRYPEPTDIVNYEKLEKIFANVHIAKEWYKNPFPAWKALKLIERGELEPYYDGIQSRKRYAKFWKGVEYDPDVIKFQSTDTSRTGASAMAFAEGLFNGKGPLDTCKSQPVYISSLPGYLDYVLQPQVACPRWYLTILNNTDYLEQAYIYGNKTLAPIAERISKEYNLNPSLDPHLMPYVFTYCEFWLLHFNRTDTWCSLLSPKDLLLLRYHWDIFHYHVLQYGHPFNKRMGCVYLTQLVTGVDNFLNGKSFMIADIKNSHSYSLLALFTSLGVFKEKYPLTADLPYEKIKEVKFTEFASIPWSSMVYFKIYTCQKNEVLIRMVLNFKPILISGCGGEYCKWEKFKEVIGDQIG